MGGLMDLPSLGIYFVDNASELVRNAAIRTGFTPLAWDHDRRPGLVWRVPDPEIKSASIFSRVQGVLVREFEQAVVLHNGTVYAHLAPGVYDIRKLPVKDVVEVIWVSTQATQHRWGVGRVINREDISIGAHGFVFLQIADARKFVLGVIAGGRKFTLQNLEDWVFGVVAGIMRTQIAASTIRDLMQAQEEFARACSNRLAQAFGEWGIQFKNLVVNQFDVPQEYRDAVARVTLSRYERDSAVIAADAAAETLRIRSKAEAEARLTAGSADIELMARMQSYGLDPIRLKAVEALTQYAQLAAQTGGGGDSGSDIVKMMLFMQMSRLLTDPGMPGEAKDALRAQFPVEAAQVAQVAQLQTPLSTTTEAAQGQGDAAEGVEAASGEAERARVQRILDNLDERLASGEIQEATYDRLRAKWEARLAALDAEESSPSTAE